MACNYSLSGQTTWYEPDTIIYYDVSEDYALRSIYAYDNSGNRELFLVQKWNVNQWENVDKSFYTYDASDNMLTNFSQTWSNSQWGDTNKTIYTYNNYDKRLTTLTQTNQLNKNLTVYKYDDRGNNVESLGQDWNNNQWENTVLYLYEYDDNNNQICFTNIRWQNNQWDSNSRFFYDYNANNKVIEDYSQRFYNNQWNNQYRNTYTYDTNGNRLEIKDFEWKDSLWVRSDRYYIQTYDGNNNLLTSMDSIIGTYSTNSIKKIYTYDGSNNMLTALIEGLTGGGMWYTKTQNIYTYDEHNNKLSDSAVYMIGTGIWYNDFVFKWEYDENSNAVSGFNQKWDFGLEDWKNENTKTIIIYYNNMQSYVGRSNLYEPNGIGYKFVASYKKIETVGIAKTHNYASVLRVYPNPANGQLKIKNEELRENTEYQIFSVVGQVVMVGAYPCGSPEMTIDVSHLASGMYFLKIGNKTVKFVKE